MKSANHLKVRTEHALTKEKGRTDQSVPQGQPITERHSTTADPLQGWHDLAKPSRERQPKRSWKRGKQRGRIDAYLLPELAMLATIALLLVGGLSHG